MSLRLSQRTLQSTLSSIYSAGGARRSFHLTTTVGKKAESKTPSSAPSAPLENSSLSWPEYFSLRRSRHKYGIYTTIPTTIFSGLIGFGTVGSLETNPTELIFGFDPLVVYGVSTLGITMLGYLVGPPLGTSLWRWRNKGSLSQMDLKDKEFHAHLIRNRADPVRQSFANPVPDYYGEKVQSIKGYRQWLRDQNAYRRKAQFGDEPI